MPSKIPVYYAYKQGMCTTFDKLVDAQKYSKIIETGCLNKIERDDIKKQQESFDNQVMSVWMDALKQEYNSLVQIGIFDEVFSKAYERGHSYGMDEVASEMDSLDEFLDDILLKHAKYLIK